MRPSLLVSSFFALASIGMVYAQPVPPVTVTGTIYHPTPVPPNPENRNKLQLPDGFYVHKFAEGLNNPRIICVGPNGSVYVTSRKNANVVLLKDTNQDGVADSAVQVAQLSNLHGITIRNNTAYLVGVRNLWTAQINPDGTFQTPKHVINDLPDAGQHHNRTLKFGPDGMLYVSIGSTTNVADEPNIENATIVRVNPNTWERRVFASGLRNTIGFDWDTQGNLFGWDQGMDWQGDDESLEEINLIEANRRYGWPYIYEDGKFNPQHLPKPEKGYTVEQWIRESRSPKLMHTAHSSGMQFQFYRGTMFPADYREDAIVTLRGSWNRRIPSGYQVVRVIFENGNPVRIEPLMTGFLQPLGDDMFAQFGRPTGLATLPDGSVLIGDDTHGVIYRITTTPPTAAARRNWDADTTQVTENLVESTETITVTSPAFTDGGALPEKYSAYADNLTPPLQFDNVPPGTRALIVLMEDPDADMKPFIHWAAAFPANTRTIPEGWKPSGSAIAGSNSNGTTLYFGPKPPKGDPPHGYRFQVFAVADPFPWTRGFTRAAALDFLSQTRVLAKGTIVGHYSKP